MEVYGCKVSTCYVNSYNTNPKLTVCILECIMDIGYKFE